MPRRKPRGADRTFLASLSPGETARVLRRLLDRHPELEPEAAELAQALVSDVDADAIAEEVKSSLLAVDFGEMQARSGPHRGGYVDPSEAAWESLQEAVDPFLDDMLRRLELGLTEAAAAECMGIVLGLYELRDHEGDTVLAWAPDFPLEAAAWAVSRLRKVSRAKAKVRSALLVTSFLERIPAWAGAIRDSASGR